MYKNSMKLVISAYTFNTSFISDNRLQVDKKNLCK